MRALITGAGNMGRAIRGELEARGDQVVAMLGRPGPDRAARPDPSALAPVDIAFEFSHASSVVENVGYASGAGCRTIVIGTTGWSADPAIAGELELLADRSQLRIVVAPTFSLGAVLFSELAEEAARRFGRFADYDPYVLEWHRRSKVDRPSGTALAIADRLLPHLGAKRRARLADGTGAPDPETLEVVALRAGASPGMHLVGFDAPGESIELRITARDRSAYVSGALLAADRLLAAPDRGPGLIGFDALVREILADGPSLPSTRIDQAPQEAFHASR
jgi:4-hydroxy-tetrahydrodipicolinate reductase